MWEAGKGKLRRKERIAESEVRADGSELLERARAEGELGELQRSRGQEGRANGRNLRELLALTPECSTAVCRRPAKDGRFYGHGYQGTHTKRRNAQNRVHP